MEFLDKLTTTTKVKLGLIICLIILVFSLFLSENATPSSFFFPLKRLQEKIFLKLKPNAPAKVEYLSTLLDIRLSELKAMVDARDYTAILDASLRYSATAGNLTEDILSSGLANQGEALKAKLVEHKKALEQILQAYPVDLNTERKYIEDDINYISIYIDKLSAGLSSMTKSDSTSN